MANDLRNLFFGFMLFSAVAVLVVSIILGMATNYGVSDAKTGHSGIYTAQSAHHTERLLA